MKILTQSLATAFVLILLIGCSPKSDDQAAKTEPPVAPATPQTPLERQLAVIAETYPEAKSTESGLHYIVQQEGTGNTTPNVGDTVMAHYTGMHLNGEVFDSSVKRGTPYPFKVGTGGVIKGWDEAFLLMKVGEKRKLIIPSNLAYGSRDYGPIPAHSTLIFDVELVSFE